MSTLILVMTSSLIMEAYARELLTAGFKNTGLLSLTSSTFTMTSQKLSKASGLPPSRATIFNCKNVPYCHHTFVFN